MAREREPSSDLAPSAGNASSSEILQGLIERVTYSDPTSLYSVLRIVPDKGYAAPAGTQMFRSERLTAVGKTDAPSAGVRVRLSGRWTTHPAHGPQFEFDLFEVLPPSDKSGLVKYLSSDKFHGIGEKLAERIVDHLGDNAIDEILQHPEKLAGIRGLKAAVRDNLVQSALLEHGVHRANVFLRGLGLGPVHTAAVVRKLGPAAEDRVRADPYVLASGIPGIGFGTADRIAMSLGLASDDPRRARAALVHTLKQASDDGHSLLPRARLIDEARRLLSDVIGQERFNEALDQLDRTGEVTIETMPLQRQTRMSVSSDPRADDVERSGAVHEAPMDDGRFEDGEGSGAWREETSSEPSAEPEASHDVRAGLDASHDVRRAELDASHDVRRAELDASHDVRQARLEASPSVQAGLEPSPNVRAELKASPDAREAGIEASPHLRQPELEASHDVRRAGLDASRDVLRADLEHSTEALRVEREVDVGEARVYLPALAHCESDLANNLVHLLRSGPVKPWASREQLASAERRFKLDLHPLQRDAVLGLLETPVGLLTGGPGVGKTTIVRLLVALAEAAQARVLLASPTGRAAKRLSEATGRDAQTVHRMLGWDPSTQGFLHDAKNPLEADLVVVDEISMLDVILAHHLMKAIQPPTRVIFVGDPNQLPSVGPGNVLHDLIGSGVVATFRLTQIYRQAQDSLIVTNAHRILHGEAPILPERGDVSSDFYFFPVDDPEKCAELTVDVVTRRVPERFGFKWIDDVQVISPMYRGPCGVDALNDRLRAENVRGKHGALESRQGTHDVRQVTHESRQVAHEIRQGSRVWREGDRVIHTRNDYEKEVFNGDMGKIVRVFDTAEPTLVVKYPEREVTYTAGEISDLQPAFAITVHRSQGGEFPAVVLPLVTQHYMMLQRHLLYTAVTRAKKLVVIVGSQRALRMAIENAEQRERQSALADRLKRALEPA